MSTGYIKEWLNGGCVLCGNSRPLNLAMVCEECFQESRTRPLCSDARNLIEAAGYNSGANPRNGSLLPVKQEPAPVIHQTAAVNAHKELLTRLSDFLADLPSGSLDRARNLECMTLRREIANAIVPADKKAK